MQERVIVRQDDKAGHGKSRTCLELVAASQKDGVPAAAKPALSHPTKEAPP
jgi:hypothetical protein